MRNKKYVDLHAVQDVAKAASETVHILSLMICDASNPVCLRREY